MEAQGRLAQTQAAEAGSRTGPQQVAVMRARARSADAIVQQKRAALQQAQLNLQYCTVVAPVSGVVKKNVEVGMNAQVGQPLLSIAEVDDVWVTANFKESQLQRIRPGQKVNISVDAYGRNYTGHVESVAGASGARYSLLPPENATGQLRKGRAAPARKDCARPGPKQRSPAAPGHVRHTEGPGAMSEAVATFPGELAPARPAINPWIIAIAVTLATFMEVLDTSIANVALPHIAGGSPRAWMRAPGF